MRSVVQEKTSIQIFVKIVLETIWVTLQMNYFSESF